MLFPCHCVLQSILERARQRREALKTRLQEVSAGAERKRAADAGGHNENYCVDQGDDVDDDGIYAVGVN